MIDLHWIADPWLNYDIEETLDKARIAKVRTIVLPLYADIHQFNPELHRRHMDLLATLTQEFEVIGRLMWEGRPPQPHAYVLAWRRTIEDARARGVKAVIIHNEPNLESGGEGWGSADADALDFCRWLASVCDIMAELWPDLKRVFPGLAVKQRDLEWTIIATSSLNTPDLRRKVHAWGVHIYWEEGHDDDAEWGQRHYILRAAIGENIPIWCTEFANSSREVPIAEKARQYVRWASDAPEWLEKKICFTLGGEGWESFTVDGEASEEIGVYNGPSNE